MILKRELKAIFKLKDILFCFFEHNIFNKKLIFLFLNKKKFEKNKMLPDETKFFLLKLIFL